MIAKMNNGVETDIIIIIFPKFKKQSNKLSMELGMLFSVASISLVNLLTILPVGVDSKNLKGLLKTEKRSLSCKNLVAFINIPTKHRFLRNPIKPK
jgi:hypothetical protein